MTKKAVWNKKTEEYLNKVISLGATAAQAVDEIYNKFDMIFTRNAIIGKARRLNIEFIRGAKNKYLNGSVNHENTSKQKKVNNSKFIKAWENGTNIIEMEIMFGIKRRSIYDKAKRLKLELRQKPKPKFNKQYFSNLKTFAPNFEGGQIKDPTLFKRTEFPNPDAKAVSFEDLDYKGCRFIIGDGPAKDFLFCGSPIQDGSDVPYCSFCRPIVYVKSRYQEAINLSKIK
jgi:hypothetical protein